MVKTEEKIKICIKYRVYLELIFNRRENQNMYKIPCIFRIDIYYWKRSYITKAII